MDDRDPAGVRWAAALCCVTAYPLGLAGVGCAALGVYRGSPALACVGVAGWVAAVVLTGMAAGLRWMGDRHPIS